MSSGYPFNNRSKDQRSRPQGHKVQKHISVEGNRMAGMSLHFIECLPSSYLWKPVSYSYYLLY